MDHRFSLALGFLLVAAVASAKGGAKPGSPRPSIDPKIATPPQAKKIPHVTTAHGETRVDDYFWLREKGKPEVTAYLEAENAYTKKVLAPMEPLEKKIYDEIVSRTKETDLSVPSKRGDYWYYTRTEKGMQYPIHCRKKGSLEAAEQIVLDENEMAKGEKFFELGDFEVSDDGNLLAFTIDITGYRQYTLEVKNLATGEILPDRAEKVTGLAWCADNATLYYGAEDAAKRPAKLFRHRLGSAEADPLVFEEKDELYRIDVGRTRDHAFVILASGSSTTSEYRLLKATETTGEFRTVLPRREGHEYHVTHREGQLWIRTNDGAKDFRVVTAPVADPRRENWKEILPARPGIRVEGIEVFRDFVVVEEREKGLEKIRILPLAPEGPSWTVDFPEPAYSIFGEANAEFDATAYRFRYQSLVTPASIYEYRIADRKLELLKKTEVPGYDSTRYAMERSWATAKDGVKVPVTLLFRKGTRRDGSNPLHLYGYGSYGWALPVTFNVSRFSLVDRGVVFAIAHVRGGGEMGEEWWEGGKLMNKKNTFTDFIAVAEQLVKEKWTSKGKITAQGGSAGGLLIGAIVNMRGDLWKAIVADVPFVDVINTMLDASLPLTVGEYLEWGNPNERPAYDYMKSYSPYDNVRPKSYPPMLVTTSLNDSQVGYWEPAKWVAKLRTKKTDENPLLFRCNMDAGHGGASGRYDAFKERAFEYAFVLFEQGITE
jgi:oligopeptidase B